MESSVVFCLVLLWTAVFTAGPGECNSHVYWNREVKDMLPQDQKSMVTIQGWLHGFPQEFQKWYGDQTNSKFKSWFFKETSTKFKKSFASSSEDNRDWFVEEAGTKFFQWYSEYAEWFETYAHSLEDKEKFFDQLAKKFHHVMAIKKIGKTAGGKTMIAVRITDDIENAPADRPKIYIQCLIHGRDWVSGAVCEYFGAYLVGNYKEVKSILTKVEFVIVPVANPDGYMETRKSAKERLWCKNTKYHPYKVLSVDLKALYSCIGVNLDRNFPYQWEGGPVKIHSKIGYINWCSDDYTGPKPGSESEVQAIIKTISDMRPVYGAIDFHSFGQRVFFPNAWTDQPPEEFEQLIKVASRTAYAMTKSNTKHYYSPVNGETSPHLARGTFLDWVYSDKVAEKNKDVNGQLYRVTPIAIYLRPFKEQAAIGYKLPAEEIKHTCFEAYRGIMKFTRLVLHEPIQYNGN